MNLGENLGNSFDYAKKMFSDGVRLIILIVLDLIPIVNWIVVGYGARVLRDAPASEAPPRLERYGDLFVNGAKVFFAALVYMIVPMALMFAGIASLLFPMLTQIQGPGFIPDPTSMMMLGGTGLTLVVVGFILAVFFLIILGVGLAHMIKTGRFGKAFAFGEIFRIIGGIGWGRYLGWIIIVVIIALVIGGVAGLIPFIGWIVSAIISPVLTVFVFRSLGTLYNDGAPPELRVQAPPVAAGGIVCASCGTTMQPHHKFCPSCGAPAPIPPPPPAAVPGVKFCISCGAKIPATASFCGSCGARQT